MDQKTHMSPPWYNYFRELVALFGKDPEIYLDYNEEKMTISLYVNNSAKAEALTRLLPVEKNFGGVTVYIKVVPANNAESLNQIFTNAFTGNPVFEFAATLTDRYTNPINFVVFKNDVVQYWNDDLMDYYGQRSTLYQEIAKDVFSHIDGVFFSTQKADNTIVEQS